MGNAFSSMQSMKTVGGWTAVILAGVGYYMWTTQQSKAKQHVPFKGRNALSNQPKKEKNAKKHRVAEFANQAKTQPKLPAAEAIAPETKTAPVPSKSKDEIDDRAFAQRMANNKQNKFVAKTSSDQKHKQKSVKQSQANKAKADNKVAVADEILKESAPSSTADGDDDAEDDQSPINSPSVSAAGATGVSDMLEQPSPGPSVLRLTNTEEKPPQAKKAKALEQTETKKQRQNRQKREQGKIGREEAEKERKLLEEKQRQAARSAEGRSAAQKAVAWAANVATNTNGVSRNGSSHAREPLDTFDVKSQNNTEPTSKAASTASATTNGEGVGDRSKQNGKRSDWAEVSLSEEQQFKMIEEEEDWKPVEKKKAKKPKKTNPGVASSEDGSVNEYTPPAATASSAPKSQAASTNGRPKPQAMTTQSSFAALADDGADLEDEAEEWDV